MKCYNCGTDLTGDNRCPNCGIDVKVYKKIVMTSNYYYNQGLERSNVRDLSGAIESLKKSLRFDKTNIQARNLLGLVLFETGEAVSAMGEWVISKSLQPKDNDAGRYLDAVQKNPAQLETVNQTIKKYNQALLYCRQNSTDLAIIQLKKVLSLNPKLVKGHQLLALLYMKENKFEQAKKSLRAAMKIDSSNTITLRYMKETNQMLRSANSGKKKKKEDDLISYKSGNDLIIQPTKFKDTSGFATILTILLGVAIGVAVTCFLVVPSVKQKAKSDANTSVVQANDTITTKNQQITNLENQIDDLNQQVSSAKSDSEETSNKISSYDQLLSAYKSFQEGDITAAGDALSGVKEENLSDTAKEIYQNINATVNDQYLQVTYADSYQAYSNYNYEEAKTGFEKVVEMDEAYQDGNAIYYLAQTYRNLGENEKAIEYYQKVIDGYPNTERAANSSRYLEELQNAEQ